MKRIDCEGTLPPDIEINTGERFEHLSSDTDSKVYSDRRFPVDWILNSLADIIERFTSKPEICEADPSAFIESHTDVDELAPYQRYVLNSTEFTRIIDGHRQIGRSMTCIWDVVYSALRYPDITISVVSPSVVQIQGLFDRIVNTLQQIFEDSVLIPTLWVEYPFSNIRPMHFQDQSHPERIDINNGATIHGIPQNLLEERPGSDAHQQLGNADLCVVDNARHLNDQLLSEICTRQFVYSHAYSPEYNLLLSTTEIVDAMEFDRGLVIDVPEETRGYIHDDAPSVFVDRDAIENNE
jgi:hypothetical protein